MHVYYVYMYVCIYIYTPNHNQFITGGTPPCGQNYSNNIPWLRIGGLYNLFLLVTHDVFVKLHVSFGTAAPRGNVNNFRNMS